MFFRIFICVYEIFFVPLQAIYHEKLNVPVRHTIPIVLLMLMPFVARAERIDPVASETDTLKVETSRRGHLINSLDVLNGQTAGVTVGSNTNPEAMLKTFF